MSDPNGTAPTKSTPTKTTPLRGILAGGQRLLGASIRWATIKRVPPNFSVMIVGLTGLVTLGFASWWQLGVDGLLATPPNEFAVMLTAGVCNTLAFLFLARSLELAPVSQVNAVNSSQVAMSSIAGVLMFQEPASWQLGAGILLMVAGLSIRAK